MSPISDNDVEDEAGEVAANTVTRRFIDDKSSRPPFSGPGNPVNPAGSAGVANISREAARQAADASEPVNEDRPFA